MRKLTSKQQKIVQDNIRLAYSFAAKWRSRHPEHEEEILSACFYGLSKAVVLHDPTRSKLSTYAWWAMQHEVYSVLRNSCFRSGNEKLQDPEYIDETNSCVEAEDDLGRVVAKLEVSRRLPLLPRRHRRIIHKRFWQGQTLDEIGRKEGCSKERVRQLILQAMEIMRKGKV